MPTFHSSSDHSPIDTSSLEGTTLVATVPAAFSPTCTEQCVPGIAESLSELQEAGINQVLVVSSDPPFAVQAWAEEEGWTDDDIVFASDFGDEEMAGDVGRLRDEDGKHDIPAMFGNLIRRSYSLYKDGELHWRFTEEDSTQYTLRIEDIVNEL